MRSTVSDNTSTNFDSRRFVRTARAEIEAETAGMSPEKIVDYYRTYPYERSHAEMDATRLPWWESRVGGGDRESGDRDFDCIAYVRWARARMAADAEGKLCDDAQDSTIAHGDQA